MRRGANRGIAGPRAGRGFGTLVGGPAGIATIVVDNAIVLGRFWAAPTPPRAFGAARIPLTGRDGVGAAQSRPVGYRAISNVYGDVGRPDHQRIKTPPCARPRDAPIRTPPRGRQPPLPTPMLTTRSPPYGAFKRTWYEVTVQSRSHIGWNNPARCGIDTPCDVGASCAGTTSPTHHEVSHGKHQGHQGSNRYCQHLLDAAPRRAVM
jgi:hypothetical protein